MRTTVRRGALARAINAGLMPDPPITDLLDGRARHAAKRVGLTATKSRWRKDTIDNYRGFQLVNERNIVVHGSRYDLSAEQVIEWCTTPELAAKLGCTVPA